jgi:hypothetical protein
MFGRPARRSAAKTGQAKSSRFEEKNIFPQGGVDDWGGVIVNVTG